MKKNEKRLQDIYAVAGYPICFVSAKEQIGIETVKEQIEGKTFALAGPSGVGKSSLTNVLQSEIRMETGEISMKIEKRKAYNETFTGHTAFEKHLSDGHAGIQLHVYAGI